MQVILNYYVEVDTYDNKESYFGTIESMDNVIYSHEEKLKCFSFKEDMIKHLHRIVAENGYEVVDIVDTTLAPSMWEEYL